MGVTILRAGKSGVKGDQREQIFDDDVLRKINEEEHRITATRDELQNIITLCVGAFMVGRANENLKDFEKAAGFRTFARQADGILVKCRRMVGERIDAFQNITLRNNINGVNVYLTTPPEVQQPNTMINIDTRYIIPLVNQALRECAFCDCSRTDSKYCPVKQALDNIPNMSNRIEQYITPLVNDVTKCKYKFIEVGEDGK